MSAGPAWLTPDIVARMGKERDGALASELGVKKYTVWWHRNRLGIPAHQAGLPNWLTAQVMERLGKEGDTALAAELGVNKTTLHSFRKSLGIPMLVSGRNFIETRKPKWLSPEVIARLGKERDAVIAQDLGIGRLMVSRQRAHRGIPHPARERPGPSVHIPAWLTPEVAAMLGKASDGAIARGAGVCPESVRKQRLRLGVAAFLERPLPPWCTPDVFSRLGKDADSSIAAAVGLPRHVVRTLRHRLNISRVSAKGGGPKPAWLTDEVISWFGKITDVEIARIVGGACKKKSVQHHRRRLGIPASYLKWVTPEVLRMLGSCYDSEVASMAGVGETRVAVYRRSLGIPAFRDTLPPSKSYLKSLERAHRRTAAGLRAAFHTFEKPNKKHENVSKTEK